jgi:hypothetical protein
MRPFRVIRPLCALALTLAAGQPARAAWDNVFQVCCHHCRSSTSMASPISACPQPCPQQACTTRYVQRSYYQPVVTYTQRTYYEPVTTYRTSYYWEPVTSYRYSSYYDPCTGCCQQVATPTTSYRLRSQCCPVTSYLQRCQMVPVTTQQQVFYYEPITTCCTTSVGAPVMTLPPGASVQPNVGEQRSFPNPGAPNVNEGREPPIGSESNYPRNPAGRIMPEADKNTYRQPQLQAPVPAPTKTKPPVIRLDHIVAAPKTNVEGEVVKGDRGQAGAKVTFVFRDEQGVTRTATADESGRFTVTLSAGEWLVYVHDAAGDPVYQRMVEVKSDQPQHVRLVSRER